MLIIGIDPGKTGAISYINEHGRNVANKIMPLMGKEFDMSLFSEILESNSPNKLHIFIENVHAIFGSAAKATFTFGFICGAIQGIISSLGISFTLVQPKKWQAEMYQGIPEQRKAPIKITKGKRIGQYIKGRRDTKAMSLIAVKRLFPNIDLRASDRCKKAHEGIVDAILIAEYGRRLLCK